MTGTWERCAIVLGGVTFTLNQYDVRRAMIDVEPRQISKQWVEINGVRYPPKQVISQLTGMALASFTTQEAVRALRKIGFDQHRVQVDWPQVLRLVAHENGWEPQQEMPHLVSFDRSDEVVSFNPSLVSDEDALVLLERIQRGCVNLLASHM